MPCVLQAALQRSGDEGGSGNRNGNGKGSGARPGPRAGGGWWSNGDCLRCWCWWGGHGEAGGKPAHRQGPLVLAPPLGHLQTVETHETMSKRKGGPDTCTPTLGSTPTHLCSTRVTMSLAASASFLGSEKSLVACASLGFACGGSPGGEARRAPSWLDQSGGWKPPPHLCHQHAQLGEVGPVVGVARPALPHDGVQLLGAVGRFLQALALPLHTPQDLEPRRQKTAESGNTGRSRIPGEKTNTLEEEGVPACPTGRTRAPRSR